jgi:hypothetical protein
LESEARPSWRNRPLMKRLPLLVMAALDGSGWAAVRALDFQVTAPDGKILKREELFFTGAPPYEVTLKVGLPEGTYRTLIFVKEENRPTRPPLVESLTIGSEQYVLRKLRLPAIR